MLLSKIKDFASPVITICALLGGMAYSSGQRDQKIENISNNYIELKTEVSKLRASVEKLNDSMIRIENRNLVVSRGDKAVDKNRK